MADLVVQVAHAQLHISADVPLRVRRHKLFQRTEAVLCGMQQMTDLQRIPVQQLIPAADEAAGFVRVGQ